MNPAGKKSLLPLLGVFATALLGCVVGCSIAIHLFFGNDIHREDVDPHQRLHERLDISAEQEAGLEEMEKSFARREAELRSDLAAANAELAKVVREDGSFSPRVEAAVEKFHQAMAALQKSTLEHIFEMKSELTAEQYQRLLELASDALVEHPSEAPAHSTP